MDLREALAALRAAWWMPLVGAALGAIIGLSLSAAQTPLYTSTTQLFVSTTGSTSTSDFIQGSQFSQERLASYARLITGPRLSTAVVDQLSLTRTPEELAEQIEATPVPETVLIDVTVADRSPEQAQRIASTVAEEFRSMVGEFESVGVGSAAPVQVIVAAPADLPTSPSSPEPIRNSAVALTLGLLAGAGAAIARARLDRSVKDADLAADLAAAPVIGTVAADKSVQQRSVIHSGSLTRTAEDYRRIRTNLQFLNVDRPPTVIMISSAVPNEGKSTLAANLALTLADAGRRVTLVEADLRRPRVTRYLGMVEGAGLTNVLAGTTGVDDVLQPHGDGRLMLLAAGPTPPNPGELLGSSHMSALLDELRTRSDFVLLDAPPLLPVADSSSLAVHTDGALLTVRYGRTRTDQLEQASRALERVGARTLGVVLNFVPPRADTAAAYGYGHEYQQESTRAQR